jgi:hypothetical protein
MFIYFDPCHCSQQNAHSIIHLSTNNDISVKKQFLGFIMVEIKQRT